MPVAAQTRLYHPALAGTPPEEGNWNQLGGTSLPEEGNWNHLGGSSLCRAESLIQSEIPYRKRCLKQARAGRFVP